MSADNQATIDKMFEEFWEITLPKHVHVNVKNSQLVCSPDEEHTRRQLFQMAFGLDPPCSDEDLVKKCEDWKNLALWWEHHGEK